MKEVASLGMVVVAGLLFLAFLTTLRPRVIAAVQGDEVIDIAPMKHGLAHCEASSRAGTSPKMPGLWAAEISTQLAKPSDRSTAAQIFLPTLVTSSAAVAAYGLPFRVIFDYSHDGRACSFICAAAWRPVFGRTGLGDHAETP